MGKQPLFRRFKSRLKQLGEVARSAIAVLAFSAAGLVGLALNEGYTSKAVPDAVKGAAVPTIGFGSTGPDVKMGDTTTPPKALQRALRDVQTFEGALKRCVTVPLYQYEFDAYVNLAYNIGAYNFCHGGRPGGTSNLVRKLNAQDYAGACAAILDWKMSGPVDCSKAHNNVCEGLWSRRLQLNRQCLGNAGGAQ